MPRDPATTLPPAASSAPQVFAVRSGPPERIALILPLSGRRAAAGIAVRDGFIAAWLEESPGVRPGLVFYDEAVMSAAQAYQEAVNSGVDAVVGPLLKDAVDAIAPLVGPVPVLALNTVGDGVPMPAGFWQFGLSPEDEAREVARHALALGQRRAVALAPSTDWGQRVLNAFNAEFSVGGGQLLAWHFYASGAADFSAGIREVLDIRERASEPAVENPPDNAALTPRRRDDVDLIFMAANMGTGKLLRPQLRFFAAGDIPTYSTSAIWEDGSNGAHDLDGIMFPDAAWIVEPDARSRNAKAAIQRHWPRGSLAMSRLYALGYDAALLLPAQVSALGRGTPPAVNGVIGRLSVDDHGVVQRDFVWAEIQRGRLLPLSLSERLGVVSPASAAPASLAPAPGSTAAPTRP